MSLALTLVCSTQVLVANFGFIPLKCKVNELWYHVATNKTAKEDKEFRKNRKLNVCLPLLLQYQNFYNNKIQEFETI